MSVDIPLLADAVRGGERRAIARAITLVESRRDSHRRDAEALLAELLGDAGKAVRIGITGVPGVGKSTLIEALGTVVVEEGHRLAVLSIDPSSVVTGGSILGDKTRMEQLARNPAAFIRPSPSAGSLGGVARRTRESMIVLEAAGHDVVIVETVGVGQSETLVAEMTDLFLLALLPGGGDELQGIKRGIMELADIIVVNKADGEMRAAAGRAVADYKNALRLLPRRYRQWPVPVLSCSALQGEGIVETWQKIESFVAMSREGGYFDRRREHQRVQGFRRELHDGLLEALHADPGLGEALRQAEDAARAGTATAAAAADRLIRILFPQRHSSS